MPQTWTPCDRPHLGGVAPFTHRATWTEEPAGLYLHVPFCAAICPYCDFAVTIGGAAERARFVDDLVAEIGCWRGSEAVFDSVYLGGGTPSSLTPDELGRLLAALREAFVLHPSTAVSLEANPEDVTASLLARWRDLGVQRLSLGVQSLDDEALLFLGRRHDVRTARRSIELALASDIPSISVDLIYGIPCQPPGRWFAALREAISLEPDHLSCYELTLHEGTLFGVRARRGELIPPAEDERAELFLRTHEVLSQEGYEGYEVSNFARGLEHRSRHNLKYWRHVPYLGLGPSAHSFDGRSRWWNRRLLRNWRKAVQRGERPLDGWEEIDPRTRVFECLMLGLRTSDGVDLETLGETRAAELRAHNRPLIDRLVEDGLLEDDPHRLRPTRRGMVVADSLATSFEIR